MIKAIIFDIGGVIINLDLFRKKLESIFKPIDKQKFWSLIHTKATSLSRGEMGELDYWKIIVSETGKKVPETILKTLWTKNFEKMISIDHNILKIIKRLSFNYKMGIISNIIYSHKQLIENKGIFRFFDVVILSCDIQLSKDNKEIFKLAAKKLKVSERECVFIDDIQKFIDVASSVGMKTIWYKDPKQLVSSLRKEKVLV